jgi:hypothetical protein
MHVRNSHGAVVSFALYIAAVLPLAAEEPGPSRQGVVECARAAERSQTINVGTGIYTEQARVAAPIEIRIPGGTDPADYSNCLDTRGLVSDVNKDRYLQALEACRGERRERVGYRIAASPGRIGGDDGVADCVRQRMGGIDVEVEAIGPDAVQSAPADAAAAPP